MASTSNKKTVLITGCSAGGIGWAMAKNFHRRGYYVFATARDPSKTSGLSNATDIEILSLDVTKSESIAACRDTVATRTGGRLDVLVNNAGVEFNSPLLDTDIAEAKQLFEVNVWGMLAVIQAFAPMIVKAKGTIFNQSSIDGVLNMAWAGIFAASKAAVARMSETLQVEMAPLGVRVVTSMCGSADTPMFAKPGGPMQLPESSYYHGVQEAAWKERMDHQCQAMKVDTLAEKLVKSVVNGTSGVVWQGAFAALVRWANLLDVVWLVDKMINSSRGVKLVKMP